MSKQLSLSAHFSTALMAVFVLAIAIGGSPGELPDPASGNGPLIELTIGR